VYNLAKKEFMMVFSVCVNDTLQLLYISFNFLRLWKSCIWWAM